MVNTNTKVSDMNFQKVQYKRKCNVGQNIQSMTKVMCKWCSSSTLLLWYRSSVKNYKKSLTKWHFFSRREGNQHENCPISYLFFTLYLMRRNFKWFYLKLGCKINYLSSLKLKIIKLEFKQTIHNYTSATFQKCDISENVYDVGRYWAAIKLTLFHQILKT